MLFQMADQTADFWALLPLVSTVPRANASAVALNQRSCRSWDEMCGVATRTLAEDIHEMAFSNPPRLLVSWNLLATCLTIQSCSLEADN